MAKFIPFENLKVGETYYVYSRYWGTVLGQITISEICLSVGDCYAFTDWGEDVDETVRFEADGAYMFCGMPTDEEIEKVKDELWSKPYVPPREFEGVIYDGEKLDEKWKQLLDKLISNLRNTFDTDTRFKCGRNGYFMWASKLNYKVSELLIRGNGKCDWDSISYVEKNGEFSIHSGERDSFGWLTGVIEDKKTNKSIIYD